MQQFDRLSLHYRAPLATVKSVKFVSGCAVKHRPVIVPLPGARQEGPIQEPGQLTDRREVRWCSEA